MTVAKELIATVLDAATSSPRSKQTSIGPSEIGHPCNRFIAYKVSEAPKTWRDADPWFSVVGTAVHAWLASAFAASNLALDEPRWLVEQRVYPHPGYPGSCDLYDAQDDTVIDHKVVGVTTLRAAKRGGPSDQYRVQTQLYALGWHRMGRNPREVIIAYWPRSGYLSDLFIHREPYDPSVAINALTRLSEVSAAALTLTQMGLPLTMVAASPGDGCTYCPYRMMREGDDGCPDAAVEQAEVPRGRVASLSI